MIDQRALGVLREHPDELAQATALLAAAGYDAPRTALGAGDRALLDVHRAVTGRDLELTLTCGACDAVSSVLLGPRTVPPWEPRSVPLGPGAGVREPTYADLAGLPPDVDVATEELLRRCTVGTPSRAATADDIDAVDTTLSGPLVAVCAECGATVESPVDVQRLVLESLMRVLDDADVEVHLLARTYGWDLATIEALPPDRRSRFAWLVAEGR
ncbi:MAG TPA: hypothetical protein VGX28_09515 [Frankiaceae bacterium]|nr:hypothetical protein [Frankiaceae bacterium]